MWRIVVSASQNISANNGGFTAHFAPLRTRRRFYSAAMHLRIAFVVVLAWLHLAAVAQTAPAEPPNALDSALQQQVQQLALASAGSARPGMPRIEVAVGLLDPRLRLAPCQQVQPYVPDGVRLWGKSRIGLRCLQGPTRWNVYLPITVKVFGNALVATSGLAAGSVLAAADLTLAEIDLAEDGSAPIASTELAIGRTLARALPAGQGLRQSHLKVRQWFAAGETVTVLARGEGFSVASEAQALNAGIEGQPVRVRTESGRVLMGQPVGERRVELGL
jgi:flagellar basal body P-ring formation protein FlgA